MKQFCYISEDNQDCDRVQDVVQCQCQCCHWPDQEPGHDGPHLHQRPGAKGPGAHRPAAGVFDSSRMFRVRGGAQPQNGRT